MHKALRSLLAATALLAAASLAPSASAQTPKTLTIAQGFDPQTLWPEWRHDRVG